MQKRIQHLRQTEFSYVQKNEPTYTVSIPSALALSKEGTALNIEAKDVADLDGKKVTVTIAGTDYYRNQLVLQQRRPSQLIRVLFVIS